ncbi:hypothetical protein [Nostoc sp. MS1]|uniref:hypothetical protein n=1 Tax=Nostoc sp. MS1 TaxID=2764711 RepID=UPI001CC5C0E0|nr:hypothetical protein [Nostoc sp. MS1]
MRLILSCHRFSGVYDATQMSHVVKLWLKAEASVGVAETFKQVSSHLIGKHSEPYKPDGKHNFMHNKVVVCDNIGVFCTNPSYG